MRLNGDQKQWLPYKVIKISRSEVATHLLGGGILKNNNIDEVNCVLS